MSKVMRSLTIKYDHLFTSIEEDRDVDKLTLNKLSGSLQTYEARFNRFEDQHADKALYVKREPSSRGGSQESEDWSAWSNKGREFARGRGRNFRA